MPWTATLPLLRHRLLMHALALLAVLCILSIFFFPAHQGPYSVIHGPVTALRAMVLAFRLFCALTLLVFNPLLIKLLSRTIEGSRPRLAGVCLRLRHTLRGTPVLPAVFRC